MKRIVLTALIAIIATGFFGMAQAQDTGKVYELKMADSFPIGHPINKWAKYFMGEVDKLTKGKLKIKYYPAEQLGKMKDLLKLCQRGMTDIAYVPVSFFPGQLPLNSVMVLPYWTTSSEGTRIYTFLQESSKEILGEWAKYDVLPLFSATTSQYDVGTVKKPVTKPEDLQGLRLKSSGGMFEKIAKRYKIVPVTIAAPEVYESLQRGIVDGAIFTLPSVKGYRVNEVEKYHTLGLRMGGYAGAYVINAKAWKKLPPDIQDALKQAGKKSSLWFAQLWDKMDAGLAKKFTAGGMKIHRIAPEDRAQWEAPLKGIDKDWLEDMEKRGLPGKKVFDAFVTKAKEIVKK
jgi:TRAP-type transport system periplasmic protein